MNASNVAAEASVLGGILLDNDAFWRIDPPLSSEDFTLPLHRRVFDALDAMVREGESADVVTVAEALGEHKHMAALGELVRATPSAANVAHYADLVRRASKYQRAERVLADAQARLKANDPDEVLRETSELLSGIATNGEPSMTFANVVDAGRRYLDEAYEATRVGRLIGVDTTLARLNGFLGGFQPGRLYILGGRPGRFKSTYAWQIALRNGAAHVPVGFLSLEMGAEELARNAFASLYRVNSAMLSAGAVDAIATFRRQYDDAIRDWPIYVDTRSRTLEAIRARIMAWKAQHDVQLAIVDHVQLIATRGRSRYEELGEISRVLKATAMQARVPILLLSQLNREVEQREPRLSDLRESGNLEQDSDTVLFLHSYNQEEPYDVSAYSLIVAKNRHGPAGRSVELEIEPAFGIIRTKLP